MTQCQRIKQWLDDFGSITPLEAMHELGIMRLAARISDLEKDGVEIHHEMVKDKNRYGESVHYMRYKAV